MYEINTMVQEPMCSYKWFQDRCLIAKRIVVWPFFCTSVIPFHLHMPKIQNTLCEIITTWCNVKWDNIVNNPFILLRSKINIVFFVHNDNFTIRYNRNNDIVSPILLSFLLKDPILFHHVFHFITICFSISWNSLLTC